VTTTSGQTIRDRLTGARDRVRRLRATRWGRVLHWETVGLPLMTLATGYVFWYLSPAFLTLSNLANVARQVAALSLVAWGQAVVILSAGIDLSVGSIAALVSVFAAMGMQQYGVIGFVSFGLATGLVAGLINGLAIGRLRLAPFIATLGMLSIARGLALTTTGGVPIFGLPESAIYQIGRGYVGPVPIPVLIAAAGVVATWLLLYRTRFGMHVYAIGGNEEAATLAGVNVNRTKLLIYVYSGLMAAIAGLVLTGRVQSGQPLLAEGLELQAIGAVVIGGVSLFGGKGRLSGVIWGVILMGILANGLNLLGVSTFAQRIVVGVVIIIAVAGTEAFKNTD
jgi:ribose/xylose/arabinose/galactoside ABC-type transport system permease subunit